MILNQTTVPQKTKKPCYQPSCYEESFLSTQEGHEVFFSQWGNPKGVPVLFVHGGPGGGTDASCTRFFDPNVYRVILVDQRGCGRSQPNAMLEYNTTDHLISDFEAIRAQLCIEKWLLFGGSWGSTLALVYAKRHPNIVIHLVLRGLFLARLQDYNWLYLNGASQFFPDAWKDFIADRDVTNLIDDYGQSLHHGEEKVRAQAAKEWCRWEAAVSCLEYNEAVNQAMSASHNTYALAVIEHHYFSHQCFIPPDYLTVWDKALADIPMDLVHGRYDLCCQLSNATVWKDLYPHTQLHVVEGAGHAMLEPGIEQSLLAICDQLTKELR